MWVNRNSVRNGGTKKSSQQLVYRALEYLSEYQEGVREVTKPSLISPIHWSPPLLDKFKINVDGAVFASQKTARVGVLIKDSEGGVVGACSKKIQAFSLCCICLYSLIFPLIYSYINHASNFYVHVHSKSS